eukprot:m.1347298 g.1347298  ORF g.1347298 m.1347298 type:complete len:61 (-) comp24911_c1_seq3:1812-1994(-)
MLHKISTEVIKDESIIKSIGKSVIFLPRNRRKEKATTTAEQQQQQRQSRLKSSAVTFAPR